MQNANNAVLRTATLMIVSVTVAPHFVQLSPNFHKVYPFLVYIPYFEKKKMKVGLCDLHAVCEFAPLLTFE
jgi:hypothetical protein